MKIKRSYASLVGAILVAGAGGYVGIPAVIGFLGGKGDTGYAVFPSLLTCIMIVLLAFEFRKQWLDHNKESYIVFKFPFEGACALALIFVYYALFKFFNYYVGTAVFGLVLTMCIQRNVPIIKRAIIAVIYTVVYCAAVLVVFEMILGFRI